MVSFSLKSFFSFSLITFSKFLQRINTYILRISQNSDYNRLALDILLIIIHNIRECQGINQR